MSGDQLTLLDAPAAPKAPRWARRARSYYQPIRASQRGPHRARRLIDPWTGAEVGIDLKCVPVIRALWRLGVETISCCQGYPGLVRVEETGQTFRMEAIICFADVGRRDGWGLRRSRYRRGNQHATRLVVRLNALEPHGRWREWDWGWDWVNGGSSVMLPHEDLPYFAGMLRRLVREAAS